MLPTARVSQCDSPLFSGPRRPVLQPELRAAAPIAPGALPRMPQPASRRGAESILSSPKNLWNPGGSKMLGCSHWRRAGGPRRGASPSGCGAASRHPRENPWISANRSLAFTPPHLPPSPAPGAPAEPREQPGMGGKGQRWAGRESSFQPCGCGRPFGGTKEGSRPGPSPRTPPRRQPGTPVRRLQPTQFGSPQPGQEQRQEKRLFFFSFASRKRAFWKLSVSPPFA